MVFSVSCTTRKPRAGEQGGRDYRFVTEKTFRRLVAKGGLLEWARVHGHLYGTPRAPVERALRAGRDILLDVDPKGARRVRSMSRELGAAVLVLIVPPSWRELERRLRRRGGVPEDEIRRRMREARHFVEAYPFYDYVTVNDDLQKCLRVLTAIRAAEKHRTAEQKPFLERLMREFPKLKQGG